MSLAGDMLQVAPQVGDTAPREAPVALELRLAGAEPRSPSAAQALGHQVPPHAAESWQHVLQLREFHLQLPLATAGVQGEDIEDQGGTVQDPDLLLVHRVFQVGLLRRRQVVVEDDDRGPGGARQLGDLVGLAGADEGARMGPVELLSDGADDHGARRVGKPLELRQRVVDVPVATPVASIDTGQDRAVDDVVDDLLGRETPGGHPGPYSVFLMRSMAISRRSSGVVSEMRT